jgi:hypothetical protein
MSHAKAFTAIVLGLLLSASAVPGAQTPPPPPPPPRAPQAPPAPPAAPVPPTLPQRLPNTDDSRRIDVVLSRWVGDKRIESLPFSQLSAAPAVGQAYNSMRLGVELPTTRTTTTTANGVVRTEPVTAYLGTNIDTYLRQTAAGIYELDIRLTHTMLAQSPREPGPAMPRPITEPATRTISLNSKLTLHEGRTQRVNSGTDVITGETARLEVTVTTVK